LYFYDLEEKQIYFINKQVSKILGYDFDLVQNMPSSMLLKLIHKNDKESILQHYEKIRTDSKNKTYQIEYRLKDSKGYYKWLRNVEIVYCRKHDNTAHKILGISFDVTEYKKALKIIEKTEANYKLIYDNSPFGIVTASFNCEIVQCNKEFCSMVNMSEDELKGKDFREFLHEDAIEKFNTMIAKISADEISRIQCELQFKTKNDKFNWGRTTFTKQQGIEEVSNQLLIIIENITIQKQNQEIEERINKQIAQMQKNEVLETMAKAIAHDFSNFLTQMIGQLEITLSKTDNKTELYNELKYVYSAAQKAANVAKQLLKFGRKHEMIYEVLDINQIISDMMPLISRMAIEKVYLESKLSPAPLYIKCDKTNIEQVLYNIAINAKDAMPNGGKITIKTEKVNINDIEKTLIEQPTSSDYACVSIADTGIGIVKEHLSKIFDPGFTTKPFGTGLGLAVVHGIVKQHNGFITVDSYPNKGTTFKVYLPLTTEKPSFIDKHTPSDFSYGKQERILIVEDDNEVRSFLINALRQANYNVIACSTANEAIQIFDENNKNFDLLLTDLSLPDKTGIELAEEITLKKNTIKILISSGYPDLESYANTLHQRGWYYIPKPLSFLELISNIKYILEGKTLFYNK